MKTRILSLLPLLVCCLVAPLLAQNDFSITIPEGFGEPGRLFVVRHNGDSSDSDPGDGTCSDANGNCTLRAAIDEANANNAPADVIIFELAYPAVIELTQGVLSLTEAATQVIGPGARKLTIKRSSTAPTSSRIFNVTNADVRTRTVIRGLRLEGGFAGQSVAGGAVRIGPGAVVDMAEMWFAGNSAGSGGAISNEGTVNIARSLFVNNSATAEGGAIYLSAGSSAVLTNSTLTSNSAANGGAVYATGSLLSVNNTITHNAAVAAASSVASAAGSNVEFLNTIIGGDTSLPVTSLSGTFTSRGHNIVTDARTSAGFSNGVNNDQVSDNNTIDPLLGPLADNGGQTDTRALLVDSPAVDRGNSCVYDQSCAVAIPRLRWDQRVMYTRQTLSGIVDVGAFESGNTASSGGMSLGSFALGNGPRRIGIVLCINASTGERRARTLDVRGGYRFSGLNLGDVYVIDQRSKRGRTGPFVFAPEF